MVDLDIAALAENLKDMAANLQTFIDVQAEAIAEPRIRAAAEGARTARIEQRADAEAFDRRLADAQQEMRRQRAALEKRVRLLEVDAAEAKKAIRAVEQLKTWTNEDGRRFVFADELWAALAEAGSPAGRALADLRRKQEAAQAATISEGN